HFKFKPTRKALIFAIALVFVAAFLVRAAMLIWGDKSTDSVNPAPAASSSGSLVSDVSRSLLGAMGGAAVQPGTGKTRGHYVEERLPRMPNIPSSAPIYDGLTAPVSFPRLYCVASRDLDLYARNQQDMPTRIVNGNPTVCQCYTQQATRVDTEFSFCMAAVKRGFFDPTIPDRSQRSQDQLSGSNKAQTGSYQAHSPAASSGPVVVGLAAARAEDRMSTRLNS